MSPAEQAERVTARRPIQTLGRDWLLPGEEMFVLATSSEGARSRVRCPSSGADGWIDTSDLEPLPPSPREAMAEAVLDALRTTADRHASAARSSGSLAGISEGYRIEAIVDARIATALRDVATEFELALGMQP